MKITNLLFVFFVGSTVYAQQIPTDTLIKNIDKNVEELKDELVKKDPDPYTGQSIFEDRKGSSAIFLPSGGTFRLNTADASLKLSYVNSVSDKRFFYGVDISGKTNDGLLPLFSKGNISPGAKVNGIIGLNEFFKKCDFVDGWLSLKVGYEGSSFKLYNADTVFASQVNKVTFNTFTSSLSFNVKFGGNKILAISTGYQRVNNYSDLDEIELTDRTSVQDSTSNTTRTQEKKIKVRTGKYNVYDQIPINLDFFWTPNKNPRIGFYHYGRGKITNGKTTVGLGSGLYLLKKNNPLSSIAGITFEINDVSKISDGFGKNFTVNFVVGYNFGFTKRN